MISIARGSDPAIGRCRPVGIGLLAMCFGVALLHHSLASAQGYTSRQVIRPPATGEGQPGSQLGRKVTIDGDIAMVSETLSFPDGFMLRGYRRIAGAWQPAPELNIRAIGRQLRDLDLDGDWLVYSNYVTSNNTVNIRTLTRTTSGWTEIRSLFFTNESTGASVAISSAINLVVYGVPGFGTDPGRTTVSRRAGDGTWSDTSLNAAATQQNGARFGQSVAIVAGAVVVGAPLEDVQSGGLSIDAGAAYVFELTQNTWNGAGRLTQTTPNAGSQFGAAVAISGLDPSTPDRLLVGAPRENGSRGAVYAFRRGASSWIPAFQVTDPAPGQASKSFGADIAMDGDYAVIGAPDLDLGAGLGDAGGVYGVDFNPAFNGATLTLRSDPFAATNENMGSAVAIDRSGPTVLSGSPKVDVYGNNDQGIVLSSRGTTSAPFPNLTRTFDLGQSTWGARFGGAISVDGDALLIGAAFENVGNQQLIGAAYLYRRLSSGQYQLEQRLQSPEAATGDLFGSAVAIKGDSLLVGAPGKDAAGTTDIGRVYAYRRTAGVWNLEALISSNCATTNRRYFGKGIAFNGTRALIGGVCSVATPPGLDLGTQVRERQVDGTWIGSVIVEAPRMGGAGWDNDLAVVGIPVNSGADGNFGQGVVYGYRQDAQTLNWALVTGNAGPANPSGGFGYDISIDNGLMAVASYAVNTPVYLYRRSGTNSFLPEASVSGTGLSVNDALRSASVNAEQVAMGATTFTEAINQQGAVFLFDRQAGIWGQRQRILSPSPQTGASFGGALALLSDGSLIVSAADETRSLYNEGVVYVLAPPNPAIFSNGFED